MSDLHYTHENIIKLCQRNTQDVSAMNAEIEKEIRERVKPGDVMFDLGDLFWRTTAEPEINRFMTEVLPKGIEFYKLVGNHDQWNLWRKGGICERRVTLVADLLEIDIAHEGETTHCILSHYPFLSWSRKARGSFMIHGHTHGNIDHLNTTSPDLRIDIGYDTEIAKETGSFLVPFEAIHKKLLAKTGGVGFKEWVSKKCTAL